MSTVATTRSTRETELAEEFPVQVVAAWIGNSVAIAAKHYLKVTNDHFARAAQTPTQQPHATAGIDPQNPNEPNPRNDASAGGCKYLHKDTAPYEM